MYEKEKFDLYTKQKSLSLQTEIKKRPWENYSKDRGPTYQCYSSELNKLIDEEKNRIKSNRTSLSNGKPLHYQNSIKIQLNDLDKSEKQSLKKFQLPKNALSGQFLKTFQIPYKFPLSLTARSILLSFTNKYIYYAIDDILYLLDSNPTERDHLLDILYSSMLSLHNDFSINFFDIWIDSIYLNTNFKTNRFLQNQINSCHQTGEITIKLKLHYFTRTPVKKLESIW